MNNKCPKGKYSYSQHKMKLLSTDNKRPIETRIVKCTLCNKQKTETLDWGCLIDVFNI